MEVFDDTHCMVFKVCHVFADEQRQVVSFDLLIIVDCVGAENLEDVPVIRLC